jgi:glutamine synthetase
MFENREEACCYVRDNGIEQIDFKIVNLLGGLHHITIQASSLDEKLFERGIGFDGSSIGYKAVESGDMVLIPDPTSAFLDPFWERPTLSFLCDIAEADTREPFAGDPRSIARMAEKVLTDSGVANRSLWAPEFEFYVFDSVLYENDVHVSRYEIDSAEAYWNAGRPDVPGGSRIPRHGGYHAIPPLDRLHDMRAEVARLLEERGIDVLYHHHEVGGPGQCEIEIQRNTLTRTGDIAMIVKYFVRMVASRHGKVATFMPKPLHGEAGNGMHFHQHLFNDRKPLFYDEEGYGGLSKLALSYIAGMLDHAPALLALTNPSTNSFRRLVPGFEAPVNLFFSLANRSAAIRVPKYASLPDEKRIEFRPPDATGNPYLSMAAQLLAGLDGIRRELDPAAEGFGPIDKNVFQMPTEDRAQIRPLPSSLKDALDALESDHEFLTRDGVFTEELIQSWILTRMIRDHEAILTRPTPYEIELYFDV